MKRWHLVSAMLVLAGVILAFLAVKQMAAREAVAPPQAIVNSKDGSELILVPAGEFLMGSPKGEGEFDEHPQHKVYLSAYYIGKYEVTNEQFAKFVQETGYQAQSDWKKYYNSGTAKDPVICISWKDAMFYCKWAGLRLPTEAEWEKAARGTDGRKYPWGNNWDAKRCNWDQSSHRGRGTLPVGSFPSGASPYDCLDMAGNVREWCSDWYGENYYSQSPSYDPQGPLKRNKRGWSAIGGHGYVYRGGSWCCKEPFLRCALRYWFGPDVMDCLPPDIGFRVARSIDTR